MNVTDTIGEMIPYSGPVLYNVVTMSAAGPAPTVIAISYFFQHFSAETWKNFVETYSEFDIIAVFIPLLATLAIILFHPLPIHVFQDIIAQEW